MNIPILKLQNILRTPEVETQVIEDSKELDILVATILDDFYMEPELAPKRLAYALSAFFHLGKLEGK
jgi:hypothetical protein